MTIRGDEEQKQKDGIDLSNKADVGCTPLAMETLVKQGEVRGKPSSKRIPLLEVRYGCPVLHD